MREELEGTLKELLTVNDQARSTAVHEARKHLKKVRALIRLLRPATGEAFYKDENAAMRKAAQRMPSIRDSHVRVQTIEKLTVKSGKRRTPAGWQRCRPRLFHLGGNLAPHGDLQIGRREAEACLRRFEQGVG